MAFSCDESGRQARSLPRYFDYNKSSSRDTDEDRCGEHCSKPSLDSGGATCTHTLLVFSCILHGHILGHAFVEREGRRYVFALIFRFFRVCPRQIMYDFACSLEETALNREPRFFENARISSDTFHASKSQVREEFQLGAREGCPDGQEQHDGAPQLATSIRNINNEGNGISAWLFLHSTSREVPQLREAAEEIQRPARKHHA